MVEPFAAGQTLQKLAAGDLAGLPGAVKADAAIAAQPTRIVTAATPFVTQKVLKMVARELGISSPRVTRRWRL
jgi:hypothetical protein